MTNIPLSKRTKAEILEEYNKLMEKYEEVKMSSETIHEPESQVILEKTKNYSSDHVTQSMFELKKTIDQHIEQLSQTLSTESKKLKEIREAIELSQKNLELHHHIQVAADTLQILVDEYEKKKEMLRKEFESENFQLQESINKKKLEWKREQEEYAYHLKTERRREEESYNEERLKKERELQLREDEIRRQENELMTLRKQTEEAPKQFEKALAQKELEVIKNLEIQQKITITNLQNQWKSEKNIYELKIENLEEQIKKQNTEITSLKQEADRANKKAQELAVTIVESSAKMAAKKEEATTTHL